MCTKSRVQTYRLCERDLEGLVKILSIYRRHRMNVCSRNLKKKLTEGISSVDRSSFHNFVQRFSESLPIFPSIDRSYRPSCSRKTIEHFHKISGIDRSPVSKRLSSYFEKNYVRNLGHAKFWERLIIGTWYEKICPKSRAWTDHPLWTRFRGTGKHFVGNFEHRPDQPFESSRWTFKMFVENVGHDRSTLRASSRATVTIFLTNLARGPITPLNVFSRDTLIFFRKSRE